MSEIKNKTKQKKHSFHSVFLQREKIEGLTFISLNKESTYKKQKEIPKI